jgi:hypothetical protein
MFALALGSCPDKAAAHLILFAQDFILQSKQPACFQQLTNNKIHNTTTCLVKMIKRPKQLQLT